MKPIYHIYPCFTIKTLQHFYISAVPLNALRISQTYRRTLSSKCPQIQAKTGFKGNFVWIVISFWADCWYATKSIFDQTAQSCYDDINVMNSIAESGKEHSFHQLWKGTTFLSYWQSAASYCVMAAAGRNRFPPRRQYQNLPFPWLYGAERRTKHS